MLCSKCYAPNPPCILLWGSAYCRVLSQPMIEHKRDTKGGSLLWDTRLVGSRILHQPSQNFPSTVSTQLSFPLSFTGPYLQSGLTAHLASPIHPLSLWQKFSQWISSMPNPILACASSRTRSNTLVTLRLHTANMQRGDFFTSINCRVLSCLGYRRECLARESRP